MGAGPLRELFAFDQRTETDDGFGNTAGDFAEVFRIAAEVVGLKGSETVIASRLSGVQPYTVTVRYCDATRAVTPGWRARDTRADVAYDITTAVPRPRRDYIDFTCVAGKAA